VVRWGALGRRSVADYERVADYARVADVRAWLTCAHAGACMRQRRASQSCNGGSAQRTVIALELIDEVLDFLGRELGGGISGIGADCPHCAAQHEVKARI
jgi:hypothetical protein